jgi:P-type Cu+ transporter
MEEKTVLSVEGMTCSNCAQGISRFLQKKGLEEVNVDFSSGEVTFKENKQASIDEVIQGINSLGYHVVTEADKTTESSGKKFLSSVESRFFFCAIFTVPLLLHMFLDIPVLHNPLFQLLFCLPVFVLGLVHFGKSAWASLKTGIPNMDVLIVTGAIASFTYSVAGMVLDNGTHAQHFLFFETTATIITLVLLGNVIEKKSVLKTTSAIKELMEIQPQKANKISINKNLTEQITITDVKELRKNDAVLVNSGDVIPVDGKIYFGDATIDESALTGESIPVEKNNGDTVLAGSVIINGSIKIVTEKAGTSTVLSNIIELVKQAQFSKPAIQKLGDKISAWFVPAVILISVATFIVTAYVFDKTVAVALMNAVAVLVISCPCAMGLATPTAVAVGLGKAARQGIVIKGGSTLEMFGNLKTVVFDKTGTLTTGHFKISKLNVISGNEQEIINAIYSLEQHSSHPIAASVVRELQKQVTTAMLFTEVDEKKGIGIYATDNNGNTYSIGSYKSHSHLTDQENHQVYFSLNNKLLATIDLSDDLRAGAAELVTWLKKENLVPVILSGDSEERCSIIAKEVGIEKYFSNCLPEQKTEIIKDLKKNGKLMMIGDGINDAPSLATADIGVSFGNATNIAISSAQVILLGSSSLMVIKDAIQTGKLTLQTIKQNLFWAFFYNVLAIPVAAAGFLSPMVAALSMALSDVVVIGNSIRLRFRN